MCAAVNIPEGAYMITNKKYVGHRIAQWGEGNIYLSC